jgi:hypothetical protein
MNSVCISIRLFGTFHSKYRLVAVAKCFEMNPKDGQLGNWTSR